MLEREIWRHGTRFILRQRTITEASPYNSLQSRPRGARQSSLFVIVKDGRRVDAFLKYCNAIKAVERLGRQYLAEGK
jgi:hypothetical protein